MFKWACLTVATGFLAVLLWMVNDLRIEIRHSTQLIQDSGQSVKQHLPAIVDRTEKTSNTLSKHLPDMMEKAHTSVDTVAELAADIRQIKELLVGHNPPKDASLVAYATSVLQAIEASGGTVGQKKLTFGKGLKNALPAKDWVHSARLEATYLAFVAKSKKDLVTRLSKSKLGFAWYIEVGAAEPQPLLDWLEAHHAETREILKQG